MRERPVKDPVRPRVIAKRLAPIAALLSLAIAQVSAGDLTSLTTPQELVLGQMFAEQVGQQDPAAGSGHDPSVGSGQDQEGVRFRSSVELVNVTVTVTDKHGRFVPGLGKEDFIVYEDNQPQTVSYFSNERVPVSLGIALDTSGSMTPDKMSSARGAINRFFTALLGEDDEIFLYRFANVPELVQDWTSDRRILSRALERLYVGGGTALYDAVAEAVPMAQGGRNQKKALLVISDGNDTGSATSVGTLRGMIRESEVLVYAVGVDGRAETFTGRVPRLPLPLPLPIPGRRPWPQYPPIGGRSDGRVNAGALRSITDDTGGRTEIVRNFGDLDGATARIADELGKQYSLGYASPGKKDGRWHAIRVQVVEHPKLQVRARRGYLAN